MKNILLISGVAALGLAVSCQSRDDSYSDAEYVMFSDTLSVHPVLQGGTFNVPVISTVACDYDRTFGVEIIDKGSTAIENVNYTLASNTVVIPAGERTANVEVRPVYDSFNDTDSLSFNLELVAPDAVKWDLYGTKTKVSMFKSCPFSIDAFTGWCVVTSMFLADMPGIDNTSMQRLIWTEKGEKENTVVLTNWLHDGYDIVIGFDTSDPSNYVVTMDDDQVSSSEQYVLGQINGDDKIYVSLGTSAKSPFWTCDSSVDLTVRAYLQNFGQLLGVLGEYSNVMEWVSNEEADRLVIEEGWKKHGGPDNE